MAAPKVVPITFQGDALAAGISGFVSQLASNAAYWSGATAEYGVGSLSSVAAVQLNEQPAASLTDADIQAWLMSKIGSTAGFPQPSANTIYAIFYPAGTMITMLDGSMSCTEFGGYHSDFALGGRHVSYAVVVQCPPPVAGVSALDTLSAEASHEIIESATDPRPQDDPAWSQLDTNDRSWEVAVGGGEIGDVCAPLPGVWIRPPGIDNLVQRVWSNRAAAASHDPCQPSGLSPYFNSAPVVTDTVSVTDPSGATFQTKGVTIPVGQTKTIELDLYSDAPTAGPWTLIALDVTSALFGGSPVLALSLDKNQGRNGDKRELTIRALRKAPRGAAAFWIQNDLAAAGTVWIGVVGN